MFSQLGPLFKAQFRQTESNDTRQYIPHEERDKQKKKNQGQDKKLKSDDNWVDDASVSVVALRAFLIDFLKTMPGSEDYNLVSEPAENQEISTRPKEKKRPTDTYSAKAVRAYQTMATHAKPGVTTNENKKEITPDNKPTADKLPPKEIRDIHDLIANLDKLSQKGVETLHILKASSFVESLKQAIMKETQKFKT